MKRYGKYGRKLFSDMENMEENCEMIWKICKKVSRIVIRCGKYGTKPSWIVKRQGQYGRNVGWIVKWYGKYERKVSWNVKWYGKYGRKASRREIRKI